MSEAPVRPPRARDAREPPVMPAEETWETFSQLHDHCYIITDAALEADTRGMTAQAIEGYQKALDMMDEALAIEADDNEKIINMQKKIQRAKKETMSRLVDAQSAYAATAAPPPPGAEAPAPPSYESLYPSVPTAEGPLYPSVPQETSAVSSHLAVRVAAEVEDSQAAALMEICEDVDGGCLSLPQQAEELFSLPEGSQMFFVAPNGSVSAPSAPAALRVCRFSSGGDTPGSPAAFLQVGDWTYPLIPGCSPVLHSNFGPYMFPDLERAGHHVALLLPESVSATSRRQFESVLSDLTALVSQPAAETPPSEAPTKDTPAGRVSGGLVKGAELLSRGLVAGAGKLSQYMASGTQKLQSHIAPAAAPVQVDPRVRSGAETARKLGVGALKVSEYVVTQVGKGTMALGAYIAPHVKSTGSKLLTGTKTVSDEKTANSKMDAALEVASGAVRGFGVVYTGLETAASLLARSLANNTVTLVETRYGSDAGRVTEDGLHAAGHLAMAGHNVQSLGAKGIAKRVVKDTGKQLIHEHDSKKQGPG